MSKIIAVVGATGNQGGSVVEALLRQGEYQIRGITRNVESDQAKSLSSKGVEMVTADLNDEASLDTAFEGVTAIFAVTNFVEPFIKDGPDHAMNVEYKQGVNMARAALRTQTLKHYIWSTLANTRKVSDGKFVVPHYDGKSRVDDFIKSQPELLAKTTFLWISAYSRNFLYPLFQPFLLKSVGTYVSILPVKPSTQFHAAGDISVNVGVFVRAILSNTAKTLGGKYVFCNVETTTIGENLKLWAEVTGKRVQYLQVSYEEYEQLFPKWGALMTSTWKLMDHAGGKIWSVEELVTGADLGVQGELVTPEMAFRTTDWSPLDI